MKPEHGFLLSMGVICTIGIVALLSVLLPPQGQFQLIIYIAGGSIVVLMLVATRTHTKKHG
jgi:hypothetical protein